jgi:hypothetical protein
LLQFFERVGLLPAPPAAAAAAAAAAASSICATAVSAQTLLEEFTSCLPHVQLKRI